MEPAALGLSPEAARGTCETHRWPDGLTSLCACVLRLAVACVESPELASMWRTLCL